VLIAGLLEEFEIFGQTSTVMSALIPIAPRIYRSEDIQAVRLAPKKAWTKFIIFGQKAVNGTGEKGSTNAAHRPRAKGQTRSEGRPAFGGIRFEVWS
jgi:hypothetical protein